MFDLSPTRALRRLEPRGFREDAFLVRHLFYVTGVTDEVPMLRDGELMATFAVEGLCAATGESAQVEDVAEAVQIILAQSQPEFGFYVHRLSCRAEPALPAPIRADAFSFEIDRRWQAALTGMELRARRSFVGPTGPEVHIWTFSGTYSELTVC